MLKNKIEKIRLKAEADGKGKEFQAGISYLRESVVYDSYSADVKAKGYLYRIEGIGRKIYEQLREAIELGVY